MKKHLLLLLLLFTVKVSAENLTVTVHNTGSTTLYCVQVYHGPTQPGNGAGGWGSETMSPGSSATHTIANGSLWPNRWFRAIGSSGSGCSGTNVYGSDYYRPQNGPTSFDVYIGGGAPTNGPCTNRTYNATVSNGTLYDVTAYFKCNSVSVKTQPIKPGVTAFYTYSYNSCSNVTFDFGYTIGVATTGWTNTDGSPTFELEGVNENAPSVINPPDGSGSNYTATPQVGGTGNPSWTAYVPEANAAAWGPIIWNNTNSTDKSTMQAGFNVLAANQQRQIALETEIARNTARNSPTNIYNFTGSNSFTFTNQFSDSNIVAAINRGTVTNSENWSNLFNEINRTNTPAISNAISWIPASGYSASSAQSAANAALGDLVPAMEGVETAASNIVGVASEGTPDMTMAFAGTTINLDPFYHFPMAGTFCQILFKLVFTIGFAKFAVDLYFKTALAQSASETGGVMDAETVGGNWVGLMFALVIPVAFVTLWTAIFHFLIAGITSKITEINNLALTAGGNAIAMYLITTLFPLNYVLGLISSGLSLKLGATRLYILASQASRFLYGK